MKNKSYYQLNVKLGQMVKQQRKEIKGYSQEQLAELTSISVTTISRLEQGSQLASLPTFLKLADTLQLDINQSIPTLRKLVDENEANDISNK